MDKWQRAQQEEQRFWEQLDDFSPAPRWDIFLAQPPFALDRRTIQDKIVLEIGCGPLGYIYDIESKVSIGVDPMKESFDPKWQPFHKREVHRILAVGEHLPIRDTSIDIVLLINVLDHVEQPEKVIEQVKRICNLKGVLCLLVNTFPYPLIKSGILGHLDKRHPHRFSVTQVLKLLQLNGFDIQDLRRQKICSRVTSFRLLAGSVITHTLKVRASII